MKSNKIIIINLNSYRDSYTYNQPVKENITGEKSQQLPIRSFRIK